jgi:hypothetical protein
MCPFRPCSKHSAACFAFLLMTVLEEAIRFVQISDFMTSLLIVHLYVEPSLPSTSLQQNGIGQLPSFGEKRYSSGVVDLQDRGPGARRYFVI